MPTAKAKPAAKSIKSGLPRLGEPWKGQGGYFAGIARDDNGGPDYAIVAAPEDFGELTWQQALDKAKTFAFDGHKDYSVPTLPELQICRSNIRHRFTNKWYWSSTQSSSVSAWGQDFGSGLTGYWYKGGTSRAFVVRRVSLQAQ